MCTRKLESQRLISIQKFKFIVQVSFSSDIPVTILKSGCSFHVWTLSISIDLENIIWEAELAWAHMHFHQLDGCIHRCWVSVCVWLAATAVHRLCSEQLAKLSFPSCVCSMIQVLKLQSLFECRNMLSCENTLSTSQANDWTKVYFSGGRIESPVFHDMENRKFSQNLGNKQNWIFTENMMFYAKCFEIWTFQ